MQIAENLWSRLVALKKDCDERSEPAEFLYLGDGGFRFSDRPSRRVRDNASIVLGLSPQDLPGFEAQELIGGRAWFYASPKCDPDLARCLRLYMPLCASRLVKPAQSFVMVHMAQTVDGKVSTENGASKWIGNEANRVHSHRLRALVDGVVVGGNTARQDKPSLDVRHVHGLNPARIVLSDSFDDLDALPPVPDMRTILLRSGQSHAASRSAQGCEVIHYVSRDGRIDTDDLLGKLRSVGIYSLLIEGGPETIGSFLQAGSIDWIQLHIAPLIFGSGKSVVSLPEITAVDAAITLKNAFYTEMQDAIMITAHL